MPPGAATCRDAGAPVCAVAVMHVAAVQLADPIVAQARPLANREGARLVADQPQRQIETLPVPGITVVGYSHVAAPP